MNKNYGRMKLALHIYFSQLRKNSACRMPTMVKLILLMVTLGQMMREHNRRNPHLPPKRTWQILNGETQDVLNAISESVPLIAGV